MYECTLRETDDGQEAEYSKKQSWLVNTRSGVYSRLSECGICLFKLSNYEKQGWNYRYVPLHKQVQRSLVAKCSINSTSGAAFSGYSQVTV